MKLYGRAFLRGAIEPDTLVTIGGGTLEIEQVAHPPVEAERVAGIIAPGFRNGAGSVLPIPGGLQKP